MSRVNVSAAPVDFDGNIFQLRNGTLHIVTIEVDRL